jgi:hypothetical protein
VDFPQYSGLPYPQHLHRSTSHYCSSGTRLDSSRTLDPWILGTRCFELQSTEPTPRRPDVELPYVEGLQIKVHTPVSARAIRDLFYLYFYLDTRYVSGIARFDLSAVGHSRKPRR